MNLLLLVKAEFKRRLLELKRYPLEASANFIVITVLFLAIYSIGPTEDIRYRITRSDAAVGYFLWLFVVKTLTVVSFEVEQESKVGTLEQLYLNSSSFLGVWASRLLVDFTFGIVQTGLLAVVVTSITDIRVSPTALVIVPIALTLIAISGFGFILGGLSLLYKRIGPLHSVFQVVFLGLAISPVSSFPLWLQKLAWLLPLNPGLETIRLMTHDSISVKTTLMSHLLALWLMASLYVVIGILSFNFAHRTARARGSLASY